MKSTIARFASCVVNNHKVYNCCGSYRHLPLKNWKILTDMMVWEKLHEKRV